VDLSDFSWSNCPPLSIIKEAMELLKLHYPHRFAGMFFLNSSGIFQFVWNLLKPLAPKKVLMKTFVLPGGESMKSTLEDKLGLKNLDVSLGGNVNHKIHLDINELNEYMKTY
jgi:hypothetical protein